ncbi:pro-neuregulin-3, membrane-bound isoform [Electrophorus electricus]|uniref:pro-neuregulin-3, membrane-bound isoform n=1 Tax=Electrophorus electricus TaxID=8005 RepID=UPI0015D00DB9|nr:pro-neuregulin-3, membrane-bound isoform [Electrophorus electricus]
MSDTSGAAATSEVVILEEREGSGAAAGGRAQAEVPGRPAGWRWAAWPRQQTWLCAVPLLIGFVGLGLSLMLLKWIVVGSVRDYVPTDLVDAKGIGQDPIFLSKPSAFPKGADAAATTTTLSPSGPGGSAGPGFTTAVRGRPRTGAPPNTSPRGAGASGSQVTQKSPTQRSRGPASASTTAAFDSASHASTSSPSPSNPTVLNDSTQTWTHEQSSTERPRTTPARTHANHKTPAPTLPPLKSEHFKPCQEKDLAYCLNDGECFVIETLSGPHKHCRCKEGFQGIRCDQFLPKTDSILSDPTDHLGIEFMESKEVYKRQVLSITCIAMGISFLGTLCVALYCRSKRHREKLQAHLKESRSPKAAPGLSCRSTPRPRSGWQLQSGKNFCKNTRSSKPQGGTVHDSSFAQSPSASSIHLKGVSTGRHHRTGSLSHSAEQRSRSALRLPAHRTPPIPRGRLNPIGGSRDSGPAYQHLQEMEGSERDAEPIGLDLLKPEGALHHDSFRGMRGSYSSVWRGGHSEQCFSGSPREGSPAPYRPGSIPIIPSVHSNPNEASCMQTAAVGIDPPSAPPHGRKEDSPTVWHRTTAPTPDRAAGKQKEETWEEHRVLGHAHRKQDSSGFPVPLGARETVCVLLDSGAGLGGVAPSGPTETQLVNPRDTHKNCAQSSQ